MTFIILVNEIETSHKKFTEENLESKKKLMEEIKITSEQLGNSLHKNESLSFENANLKESIKNLEVSLERKQKELVLFENTVTKIKKSEKNLKLKKFKYQKLCKRNKREIVSTKLKNKELAKKLMTTETSLREVYFKNQNLLTENDTVMTIRYLNFKTSLNSHI